MLGDRAPLIRTQFGEALPGGVAEHRAGVDAVKIAGPIQLGAEQPDQAFPQAKGVSAANGEGKYRHGGGRDRRAGGRQAASRPPHDYARPGRNDRRQRRKEDQPEGGAASRRGLNQPLRLFQLPHQLRCGRRTVRRSLGQSPTERRLDARRKVGSRRRTGGTGSSACRAMISRGVRPPNGADPASISYTTQARLYTSLRPSRSAAPAACSGLMYEGVPMASPIAVAPPWGPARSTARATPKSAMNACPSESRMFSGLMSRCTTPRACA